MQYVVNGIHYFVARTYFAIPEAVWMSGRGGATPCAELTSTCGRYQIRATKAEIKRYAA